MPSGSESGAQGPERFRAYLVTLAKMQLGDRGGGRFDASDVVQQTMLDAHRTLGQFRGAGEAEMAAWLRRLLACNLVDALRAAGRARRDAGRERSIEAELDESSARLGAALAAEQTSPSQAAERHERAVRLAAALAELPEAQRAALELRYGQGLAIAEISERLSRGPEAVAGLLKRGTRTLRERLGEGE